MISGIGIDIVEVERIERSIKKNDGFKTLVFSLREIAYCENTGSNILSYAGKFAAKEAFLKAMGTGLRDDMAFNEIEIENDSLGKPSIRLLGKTLSTCKLSDSINVHVSVSHSKAYATAVVIIEEKG